MLLFFSGLVASKSIKMINFLTFFNCVDFLPYLLKRLNYDTHQELNSEDDSKKKKYEMKINSTSSRKIFKDLDSIEKVEDEDISLDFICSTYCGFQAEASKYEINLKFWPRTVQDKQYPGFYPVGNFIVGPSHMVVISPEDHLLDKISPIIVAGSDLSMQRIYLGDIVELPIKLTCRVYSMNEEKVMFDSNDSDYQFGILKKKEMLARKTIELFDLESFKKDPASFAKEFENKLNVYSVGECHGIKFRAGFQDDVARKKNTKSALSGWMNCLSKYGLYKQLLKKLDKEFRKSQKKAADIELNFDLESELDKLGLRPIYSEYLSRKMEPSAVGNPEKDPLSENLSKSPRHNSVDFGIILQEEEYDFMDPYNHLWLEHHANIIRYGEDLTEQADEEDQLDEASDDEQDSEENSLDLIEVAKHQDSEDPSSSDYSSDDSEEIEISNKSLKRSHGDDEEGEIKDFIDECSQSKRPKL